MKKLVALVLAFVLCTSSAFAAEFTVEGASDFYGKDLSKMTKDELVTVLENFRAYASIVNGYIKVVEDMIGENTNEVVVPEGIWVIGEHIPAGTWNIKVASPRKESGVAYGKELVFNGITINPLSAGYTINFLYGKDCPTRPDTGATDNVEMRLENGAYIHIKGYSVIFTPVEKIDFGFDW